MYRIVRLSLPRTILPIILLFLGGCASSNNTSKEDQPELFSQVTDAVVVPLNDLNLFKDNIPPILRAAADNPYRLPEDLSCIALATEVSLLDAVLGQDLDMPVGKTDAELLEKGSEAANKAAIKALRRTTEGVIPFRSWVRKFTGAERRDKEQLTAIAAGTIRRAFIKGIGYTQGCLSPAAPYIPVLPEV